MKIKPATQVQADALTVAIDYHLCRARDLLKLADCPAALAAVRRALKSAEGAERHMLRRLQHRDPITGEPLRRPDVPADFPVRPLAPTDKAGDRATCGHCLRSWDDSIATSYTPAPSARCPFEAFH